MTLEAVHRHEKLARKSGVIFRLMAPISGAGFWRVCQGLRPAMKVDWCILLRQQQYDRYADRYRFHNEDDRGHSLITSRLMEGEGSV